MICPYCKKEAEWCDNKKVYGKRYGKSYMCYWCKDCDAYVGCHNNTRRPLGIMANRELRQWRMKTHAAVDPLWKNGEYSRKEVYGKLRSIFGEPVHIAESDIQRCKQIIKTVALVF